jgi:4-hydroxy-tetrahydrodipicolinate synthase
MRVNWRGVFPAAVTIFKGDQSVDLAATVAHLERMVKAGVDGLVLLGTVGENCSLQYSEKLDVLRAAVDGIAGKVPVLTGVAECTTALACRFSADAEKIGVNGLMVLPGMVYKSDARETIAHFRTVAGASRLPVMCYNNPVSYGVDLTPPMFAELADVPTLAAIKESSDNVRRITDLVNEVGERYTLFVGVDDLALEAALLGAVGWVAGLVNAFPRETCVLWKLASSGRFEEARALYRWFTPLLHMDTHVKLVQYIKLAMVECGLGSETVRAPRLPLEGQERRVAIEEIEKALAMRPAIDADVHARA